MDESPPQTPSAALLTRSSMAASRVNGLESVYSCGWDVVHACNYRCPYCFFLPSWAVDQAAMDQRHLS